MNGAMNGAMTGTAPTPLVRPNARPWLTRRVLDRVLSKLYAGDWPGRLWARMPAASRVERVHRELALLPAGLDPIRLAFVSDLHFGPTTPPPALDRAFSLLHEARPDVLVLGGDYVFLHATHRKLVALEDRVRSVPARLKVAVLGNHDLWTDYTDIEAALVRAGVQLLTNTACKLPGTGGRVALLGLDEPAFGCPDTEAALTACGDAEVRLAVCHTTDAVPWLKDRGVSLLMAGHTHGGHLALPWGPLYVPGRFGRRYPHGWHRVDELELFVSRGVGAVMAPPRSWAPPDVAVLDLVAVPAGVSTTEACPTGP
jgi:predicted MPP superfamily phosphohydrolase